MDISIYNASQRYGNDLDYNLTGASYAPENPGRSWRIRSPQMTTRTITGHNCHGYAGGVAVQAGATNFDPDVFGLDLGNGTPIPPYAFDEVEEDQE